MKLLNFNSQNIICSGLTVPKAKSALNVLLKATNNIGDIKMLDTYQVEFYNKDGQRVGMQVQAYSSYDAQRFVEQMPNYNYLAQFPTKIN